MTNIISNKDMLGYYQAKGMLGLTYWDIHYLLTSGLYRNLDFNMMQFINLALMEEVFMLGIVRGDRHISDFFIKPQDTVVISRVVKNDEGVTFSDELLANFLGAYAKSIAREFASNGEWEDFDDESVADTNTNTNTNTMVLPKGASFQKWKLVMQYWDAVDLCCGYSEKWESGEADDTEINREFFRHFNKIWEVYVNECKKYKRTPDKNMYQYFKQKYS